MILVDSTVWIDYFRGEMTPQTEKLDELLGTSEELLTGDLIVAEVLQGTNRESDFENAWEVMSSFPHVPIGGLDIAVQAARNYRALRSLGITIRKTIDTMIATRCIESGLWLLHSDRDFDPFARYLGLRL